MAVSDAKPVHTIILDTGPIVKNTPAPSTLISSAHSLITTPDIISEIRDATTRQRFDTLLRPFVTIRAATPKSLEVVRDFARRTGDLAVLSKQDLGILALAYELECERNGGDWRLRRVPGQKGLNGKPPKKNKKDASVTDSHPVEDSSLSATDSTICSSTSDKATTQELSTPEVDVAAKIASINLDQEPSVQKEDDTEIEAIENSSDDSEWITPSNIKKHQIKDSIESYKTKPSRTRNMEVATITTDFAMQNVLLQMNLNLLSPSLQRIRQLNNYILRCHGCFKTTKVMTKQFCPSCGQPNLTRVACSTDANGQFKLHLKKDYQWNKRGDRYSIPKPVEGSANGRVKRGGGKNGWGQGLILAEDQKEYIRANEQQRRLRERDLMDDDYLPGILTGERLGHGSKIRIGAGRNINATSRR